MSNEFGKDWRIAIGDGGINGAETFVPIGGETSLDWKRASTEQDTSDKDSGTYGSTDYGQQKLTFSVGGNLKIPDAGFTLLNAAAKASPPRVNVEIKKGAVIKFKGLVGVGNLSATFPLAGPATFSVDLANNGTPTIDAMDAVV